MPAVAFSDELSGSLRDLKPATNIVSEQMKRFEKRRLIEPRLRHKLERRYKLTSFTRRGHKEDDWQRSLTNPIAALKAAE